MFHLASDLRCKVTLFFLSDNVVKSFIDEKTSVVGYFKLVQVLGGV